MVVVEEEGNPVEDVPDGVAAGVALDVPVRTGGVAAGVVDRSSRPADVADLGQVPLSLPGHSLGDDPLDGRRSDRVDVEQQAEGGEKFGHRGAGPDGGDDRRRPRGVESIDKLNERGEVIRERLRQDHNVGQLLV